MLVALDGWLEGNCPKREVAVKCIYICMLANLYPYFDIPSSVRWINVA